MTLAPPAFEQRLGRGEQPDIQGHARHVLKAGMLAVRRLTEQGDAVTLLTLQDGDAVPHAFSADAYEVAAMMRSKVVRDIGPAPEVGLPLLERAFELTMVRTLHGPDAILAALAYLARTPAAQRTPEGLVITLTHEDIASIVGVARESLSHRLVTLEENGKLKRNRSRCAKEPHGILLVGSWWR